MLVEFSVIIAVIAAATQVAQTNNTYTGTTPRYVFLFISDGIGYSQIYAAEAYKARLFPKSVFVMAFMRKWIGSKVLSICSILLECYFSFADPFTNYNLSKAIFVH